MESFSEAKQLARVKAGYKGGPFFQNPITHNGKMSFVKGWPSEVTAKSKMTPFSKMTPVDAVWASRRSK